MSARRAGRENPALVYWARRIAVAKKPNILVMWGDDIGQSNLSCFTKGMMGYRTPNIDRVGNEGVAFTDYYAQQSCTAGRAAFITGQNPIRTGLTKVGMPGATNGMQAEDPTIADLLKPLVDLVNDDDEPEIRIEAQPAIVQWMLYRAYSKQDADTFDPQKAARALAEFEREFGRKTSARNEQWMRSDHVVGADPIA